ncbi:MAG: hypothetical protein FVQ84_17100 [Planctomycetes bacterium]|nr:hypothetical protein [Planctomycetota bacterium]
MSENANEIDRICTHEEFERFKSIYERFTKLVSEKAILSDDEFWELSNDLGDDIEEFWPKLIEAGKELGIDLSDKLQPLIDILEEGANPVHPSTYVNSWVGGPDWAFDDAVAGEFAEYEAKLKDRRELIADLDKVMVNIYALQPKDKNQGPIYNIQNSNIILGDVDQPGNLQIGNHPPIQEISVKGDEKKGILKRLCKIIGPIIVGIIVFIITDILGDLGYVQRIKDFIYRIIGSN